MNRLLRPFDLRCRYLRCPRIVPRPADLSHGLGWCYPLLVALLVDLGFAADSDWQATARSRLLRSRSEVGGDEVNQGVGVERRRMKSVRHGANCGALPVARCDATRQSFDSASAKELAGVATHGCACSEVDGCSTGMFAAVIVDPVRDALASCGADPFQH